MAAEPSGGGSGRLASDSDEGAVHQPSAGRPVPPPGAFALGAGAATGAAPGAGLHWRPSRITQPLDDLGLIQGGGGGGGRELALRRPPSPSHGPVVRGLDQDAHLGRLLDWERGPQMRKQTRILVQNSRRKRAFVPLHDHLEAARPVQCVPSTPALHHWTLQERDRARERELQREREQQHAREREERRQVMHDEATQRQRLWDQRLREEEAERHAKARATDAASPLTAATRASAASYLSASLQSPPSPLPPGASPRGGRPHHRTTASPQRWSAPWRVRLRRCAATS